VRLSCKIVLICGSRLQFRNKFNRRIKRDEEELLYFSFASNDECIATFKIQVYTNYPYQVMSVSFASAYRNNNMRLHEERRNQLI